MIRVLMDSQLPRSVIDSKDQSKGTEGVTLDHHEPKRRPCDFARVSLAPDACSYNSKTAFKDASERLTTVVSSGIVADVACYCFCD